MKLPKILLSKKFLFLLTFLFLFFAARKAFAYIPSSNSFTEGLKNEGWEKSSFDFTTINNVLETITVDIIGSPDPLLNNKLGNNVVGAVGSLIAGLYANPPASSREYFADLGQNLGLVRLVYAQGGPGSGHLGQILPIWKAFRNVAYLLFVIIFVVLGFAIMFRARINPQTVVTIQSSLPRIILALVLVTFSYAIAGLMIDFIYVLIYLFLNLFPDVKSNIDIQRNVFVGASQLFGIGRLAASAGQQINEFIQGIFSGLPGHGTVLGFATGVLGTAVLAIAIAFSLFKLFFSLLMSYISVIFGVIFSPFILMLGALPGQKGFSQWLKLMIGNLIVFPVTALVFIIVAKAKTISPGDIWLAPFIGGAKETTQTYISTILAVGIVLYLPALLDTIKKVFMPGGAGIAQAIIAPIGATAGVLQKGWQKVTEPRRVYREERLKWRAAQKLQGKTP